MDTLGRKQNLKSIKYYYNRVNLYSFLVLVVFSPLLSIFSALLEDSKKVSFQRGFARYLLAISRTCADSPNFYDLRLLRVPVQGVNILVVLGEIAIDIKNNVIYHNMSSVKMNNGKFPYSFSVHYPYAG